MVGHNFTLNYINLLLLLYYSIIINSCEDTKEKLS